jgi:hypothetical protein
MKKKLVERNNLMERTRATVAYINGAHRRGTEEDDAIEMEAFMSIFHPNFHYPKGQDARSFAREVARDKRQRGKR